MRREMRDCLALACLQASQLTSSIFPENNPRAAGDILRNVSSLKMITRSSWNFDLSSFPMRSSLVTWSQARSISFYTWYLFSSRIIL